MKQKERLVLNITGFFFRMSNVVNVEKPVISNRDNFFCFNNNTYNLYNNDVTIYKINKKS
jgi:hypothetical protein